METNMPIVAIISRRARHEDINLVERLVADAGLETQLFVFGQDENANALVAVQLAEAHLASLHPIEIWVAPGELARLDAEHRVNARNARSQLGFEERQDRPARIIVCTDGMPAIPSEPEVHMTSVEEINSGAFGADLLRSIFS